MKSLPPFEFQPAPYSGPPIREVVRLRREFLTPAIFHFYRDPLMIVSGADNTSSTRKAAGIWTVSATSSPWPRESATDARWALW